MLLELFVSQSLRFAAAALGNARGSAPLQAAADRSVIREQDGSVTLPPAGASRAEAVFTTVGLILVLAIVLSTLWILLRRRR